MLVLANCGKFSFSFFGSREDLMQLFCVSFSIANLYTERLFLHRFQGFASQQAFTRSGLSQ